MEYKIIEMEKTPVKTNCSAGNWAVHMIVKYKDFPTTNHTKLFFKKKDALKYIVSNNTTINL